MAIKLANEITVKVNTTKENIITILLKNNFKKLNEFSLEDYYYIPANLNLTTLTEREILKQAIIIRNLTTIDKTKTLSTRLTFKKKDISPSGEIITQTAYNVEVKNVQDAKNFLEAIGYNPLMNIFENEYQYEKNNFMIEIKEVSSGYTLIEVETNEEFNSIEKIIEYFNNLNLPIDASNFFVKKAEIELSKVLPQN